MLPTIWLKSTTADAGEMVSAVSALERDASLLEAVRESYLLNAIKYFKTLQAYDSVLSSIDTTHTPASLDKILQSTVEAARSTAAINFQLYRSEDSSLWVGITFHDPDLINVRIIDLLQLALHLDSGKESMLGGIAIAKAAAVSGKAELNVTIRFSIEFSIGELAVSTLDADEKFTQDIIESVVLLLTVRNKELCATIEPQTIKEKINATRNPVV